MSTLDHALARLVAQQPRFAPSVTAPSQACTEPNGIGVLSLSDACRPESLDAAVAAGKHQFALSEDKHAAQLWLYTVLGDIASPAMNLMVESTVYPNLDLGEGTLFKREPGGYWFGFLPSGEVASAFEVGQSLGRGLAPLIDALSQHVGMRPAPLWAVAVDACVQPLMGAGNHEFETAKALGLACQVWAGLRAATGVGLPLPRIEQIADGQMLPVEGLDVLVAQLREVAPGDDGTGLDLEFDGEEPEFILSHRVSCCMIYHSPNAGLCTSCPHQDKEERIGALIAIAEGY